MTDSFFTIAAFLAEADTSCLAALAFDDICSLQGADSRRLNMLFHDHFGMSGDEVMECIRTAASCNGSFSHATAPFTDVEVPTTSTSR